MKHHIYSTLFVLTAVGIVSAQDTPPETIPDYGSGLTKFESLGMADAASGDYVTLQVHNARDLVPQFQYQSDAGIKGGAWQLSTSEDESSGQFVAGGVIVTVQDVSKVRRQEEDEVSPHPRGRWKKVNLDADLQKFQKYLDEEPEDHDWFFESNQGDLFLYALHVYQTGRTNEANRLIHRMMERADDSRELIAHGVNTMVSRRYVLALNTFYRTQDWQALIQSVQALQQQFGSMWKASPSIDILLEALAERTGESFSSALEDVTEEEQMLVDRLLNMKPQQLYNLPPLWQVVASDAVSTNELHPIVELHAKGTAAIPLLLKLLDDDVLTTMPKENLNFGSSSSDSFSAEEIYEMQIQRPATRGEIAEFILRPVLLVEDKWGFNRLDAEDVRIEVEEWLETMEDKNPRGVARYYLENGHDDQIQEAISFLCQDLQPEDVEAIEQILLEFDDDGYGIPRAIREYAQVREGEARDFVEKYIARMELDSGEEGQGDDEAQYLKSQIEGLRQLVTAEPVEVLVQQYAGADREQRTSLSMAISTRLAKKTPEEVVPMILEAALAADTAEHTLATLNLFSQYKTISRQWSLGQSPGRSSEEQPWPSINAHREQWLALSDKLTDKPAFLASLAMVVEFITDADEDYVSVYALKHSLSEDKIRPLLQARLQARIEGTPDERLPALPSADEVSEEDRERLLEDLLKLKELALIEAFQDLSMAEMLAVDALLEEEEHAEERDRLAACTRVIGSVVNGKPDQAVSEEWASRKGRPLTRESVDLLRQRVEKATLENKILQTQTTYQGPVRGYSLWYRTYDPDEPEAKRQVQQARMGRPSVGAVLAGTLWTASDSAAAIWDLGEKPPPSASTKREGEGDLMDELFDDMEEDAERDDEESKEKFHTLLNEYFEAEDFDQLRFTLRYIGIPHQPEKDHE